MPVSLDHIELESLCQMCLMQYESGLNSMEIIHNKTLDTTNHCEIVCARAPMLIVSNLGSRHLGLRLRHVSFISRFNVITTL